MSAQSFTPGPWEAIQGGDGDWFVQVAAQPKSCHPAFDRYRIIHGWVGGDGTDNPNPELGTPEANARLIAAAPDSHNANVMFVRAAERIWGIHPESSDGYIYDEMGGELSAAYFAARAAIAKAKGESA